jgi:hypothetical protein
MVAVVTELMVGGECFTQNDSIKDPLGSLASKPLTPSVALSSGQDTFALDKIFALIDEYIYADFLHPSTFPLHSHGGPYIEKLRIYFAFGGQYF